MNELVFAAPAPFDLATGGYAYDRRVAEGLRKLGWAVTLVELHGDFPAPTAAELEATRLWLAAADPEIPIIIDGLAFGALGHVAPAFKDDLCLIALVHHPLADETGLDAKTAEELRDGEMLALAAARGVIVTSPFVARRLDAYGVPPGRIRVVEPGVARRPLSRGSGGVPMLLCVASYVPRKGHDVLLAALDRIRDRHWRLVCVGATDLDPSHEAEVRLLARSFGERVELRGTVAAKTLDALYAEADLFVLASHYEGYGMAFAEAVASGLPIVATTGGATTRTVPSGAGKLVGAGDVAGLAHALAQLLDEPPERRRLAQAARVARTQQTDWDVASAKFASAVKEVAGWA